ncbi:hypothetical protein BLA29_005897 [Euroglyphus maynei]|uniref:Uncharacterized protein n=1 Tax=Euroglyphus maynei TaxID=6958 RepID=A0A1Y3AWH9_EURMA|nr:hypothetical protein BLA29_005897 [Euroglyphus maynei]
MFCVEHDSLLTLITLEQQLNHTVHSYNSIIGDIRRIGTAHNIQLVCGVNLAQIVSNENCQAFIMLLLKCSSKTAQRDLLYALENSNLSNSTNQLNQHSRRISEFVARLLPYTQRPSRWFIENILHELYRRQLMQSEQATIESSILLQSLTLLAKNEQLTKLSEILNIFIMKRIDNLLVNDSFFNESITNVHLVDLIKMLGNLDNYTAIESVHRKLMNHSSSTITFITIATIHAYRRSINRSTVQTYLAEMFHHTGSCQIRQEIVQLLIDNVDMIFMEQKQRINEEKRWPKYSFNRLDEILAQNLR